MIFRAGDDDVDCDVQGGWGKQPSDDGLGDQDCLELRQNFGFASIANVLLSLFFKSFDLIILTCHEFGSFSSTKCI